MTKATFKVINIINITGRGTFLVGDIESGVINVGDEVTLDEQNYKIHAVEMVDYISKKIAHVAIGIGNQPQMKESDIAGKTLTIK